MKQEVINYVKKNYPRTECRYSGNDKTMYIHNTGIQATPDHAAKAHLEQLFAKQISFNIKVQSWKVDLN